MTIRFVRKILGWYWQEGSFSGPKHRHWIETERGPYVTKQMAELAKPHLGHPAAAAAEQSYRETLCKNAVKARRRARNLGHSR